MFVGSRGYKANYSLVVILSILFFSADIGVAQSDVETYGQVRGEPIDGGFFFYDNKYIEAPYVVERRGLEILINGLRVDFVSEPYDWRILEDPGPPPADCKPPSSTPWPGTEHYDGYWGHKYRYICATNNDREQANLEFMDVIRKTPGVARIERDSSDSKHTTIYYSNGATQIFNLRSDSIEGYPFPPVPSKEELIKMAEKKRERFERKFKRNQGFFDRSRGGCMSMGSTAALKVVDILLSEESPEDRAKALVAKGFGQKILADPWKSQLDSIQSSTQLAERAERIRKEIEKEKRMTEAIRIGEASADWIADAGLDNRRSTNKQDLVATPLTSNNKQNSMAEPLASNDKQDSKAKLSTSNSSPLGVSGFPIVWFFAGIGVLIALGVVLGLRFSKHIHTE